MNLFLQVRSQVLLMDPLPYVSKVYALLIQEEMQRSVPHQSGVKVHSTALVAKMQTFNAGITYGSNGVKGKDKPVCTHCGKIGHIANKCYRLHGFPPFLSSRISLQWFIKSQPFNHTS
ncbi:hypothetical protein ACB092_04G103900 [Castanea dentata]